jgi:hypothetical protein
MIIAGCAGGPTPGRPAAGTFAVTSVASIPPRPRSTVDTAPGAAANPPTHDSPTRRAAGARSTTSGGAVVNAVGAILPNRVRTPGAVNPVVTPADIRSTICVSGWTATIRPPSAYTTGLKQQQLASGYSYRGDRSDGDYEEDHLISLELGGSPTSVRNLWPEPYRAPDGARIKDKIENKLHELVCAGQLGLATAQHAIARNWWTAYTTYLGTPVTIPVSHLRTTRHSEPPVSQPGNGATALCNDGTYSYAAHHQGACSHHGGVKVFYK